MFRGNSNVAFADINLSQVAIRSNHNPGAGGWPTIRYFTKETGVDGGTYEKKTAKPMCEELGDRDRMIDYVEEYSGTVLCDVDGANCNEKELGYLEKMKAKGLDEQEAQHERLKGMLEKPMKPELQEWARRRLRILKRLYRAAEEAEEANDEF